MIFICNICGGQDLINTNYVSKEIYFKVKINIKFSDNSSNSLKIKDYDSAYYDQSILILPQNYSETGALVRLVYLAHGAGGGVTDSTWAWNRWSILDSLL